MRKLVVTRRSLVGSEVFHLESPRDLIIVLLLMSSVAFICRLHFLLSYSFVKDFSTARILFAEISIDRLSDRRNGIVGVRSGQASWRHKNLRRK